MGTLLKVIGLVSLIAVIAIGGAGVYIKIQLDPKNLPTLVEQRAAPILGRTLDVGTAEVSWDGTVKLTGLTVLDQAGVEPQFRAESVTAVLSWAAMIQGGVGLSKLSIAAPWISVTRHADGTSDLDDVFQAVKARPAGGGPVSLPPNVLLTGGAATIRDEGTDQTHQLTALEVSLIPRLAGHLDIDGSLLLDGSPIAARAAYNPGSSRLDVETMSMRLPGRDLPILFEATSLEFPPDGVRVAAATVRVAGLDLQVTGEVRHSGDVQGEVKVLDADLGLLGEGYSGRVSLALKVAGTASAPRIEGTGSVSQVDIRTSGRNLQISEAAFKIPGLVVRPPYQGSIELTKLLMQVPGSTPPIGVQIAGSIQAAQDQISTQDLTVKVLGLTFRPQITLADPSGVPRIKAQTGDVEIDLESMGTLIPAEHRKEYASLAPRGRVHVNVSADGPLNKPRLAGVAEFSQVSFTAPGTGDPVSLKSGKLLFAEDRIELEPTELVIRGTPVSLSGIVANPLGARTITGQVLGRNVSLDPFVSFLPSALQSAEPRLRVDVKARVKGAPGNLTLDGGIRPLGGGLKIATASGTKILKVLPGGEVLFEGRTITLVGIPVTVDQDRYLIRGRVQQGSDRLILDQFEIGSQGGSLRGQGTVITGETPRLEGVSLSGTVDSGPFLPPGVAASPVGLDLTLSGPLATLQIGGTLSMEGASRKTENGRVRVTEIRAQLKGQPSLIELDPITARFYEGSLRGKGRRSPETGNIEFAMSMEGSQLSALLADLGQPPQVARASMSGQFSGNAQPQGIKASGEIILAGLVVDASLNPTVNRIRTTLQNQQVTSGLSATIGGLAPKLNAQEFFGARGQEAEYYHRVLQEVSRPNGLGTLKIPVGMENGYLYIAHFQNEFVAGDLQVELAPGRQGGKIEYLRLGAVELKDVQLGGTLEVPDNRFSLANLKLNGVPPPPGLRDLGTLSSSSDPASILRKDMENRVKNVVQKEIEKRMRDQAGKVLGDGLGGLLGGGSTGGESLPADPASAGQTILDALRVAPAAQPQPAPSAGAAPPAKPDVKEIGKELGEKLLRGLFK